MLRKAYQRHLAAGERSAATVRKERAALNSLLRWAKTHELISSQQANLTLSVALPTHTPAAPDTTLGGPRATLDEDLDDQ